MSIDKRCDEGEFELPRICSFKDEGYKQCNWGGE